MRTRSRSLALLGAALMVMSVTAAGATATTTHNTRSRVAAVMDLRFDWFCDNSQGPMIRITGPIRIADDTTGVAFGSTYNGGKHQVYNIGTYSVSFELSADTGVGGWPKQPSADGVGGNPYIWFRPDVGRDGTSNYTAGDYYLVGRCVKPSSDSLMGSNRVIGIPTVLDLYRTVSLTPLDCLHQGPMVSVSVTDELDGLHGEIILTNQLTYEAVHTADIGGATIEAGLGQGGGTSFRKGGGWKGYGTGGNPTVYLWQGSGTIPTGPITGTSGNVPGWNAGDWNDLGRCTKL